MIDLIKGVKISMMGKCSLEVQAAEYRFSLSKQKQPRASSSSCSPSFFGQSPHGLIDFLIFYTHWAPLYIGRMPDLLTTCRPLVDLDDFLYQTHRIGLCIYGHEPRAIDEAILFLFHFLLSQIHNSRM
jgi:hypothetical protein